MLAVVHIHKTAGTTLAGMLKLPMSSPANSLGLRSPTVAFISSSCGNCSLRFARMRSLRAAALPRAHVYISGSLIGTTHSQSLCAQRRKRGAGHTKPNP